MTDAQTEARAIARASLWVPAKPEHTKTGWSYDFEQTERISRAAYESTGYDATMEVVEFVMAEADRRHATALAAKDAELAELREADGNFWEAIARAERAEAALAEARKALEPFATAADNFDGFKIANDEEWFAYGGVQSATGSKGAIAVADLRAARRACEAQGGENG